MVSPFAGFTRSRSESHDAELSVQRKDLEALQKDLWAVKGAERGRPRSVFFMPDVKHD